MGRGNLYGNRQRDILQLLMLDNTMSVKDLAEKLDVSLVTIRRDLDTLQQQGLVKKFHGSVMICKQDSPVTLFNLSLEKNNVQKRAIASVAASLIQPNNVISIDASGTTYCVADYLPSEFPVKVITNHLLAAMRFLSCPNVEVIQIGGTLSPTTISATDYFAVQFCKDFHTDIAFLSSSSFCMPNGSFDLISAFLEIKKTFLSITNRVVFMADSSKFNKTALFVSVPIERIDTIITDDKISKESIRQIVDYGSELYIANTKDGSVLQHYNPRNVHDPAVL